MYFHNLENAVANREETKKLLLWMITIGEKKIQYSFFKMFPL